MSDVKTKQYYLKAARAGEPLNSFDECARSDEDICLASVKTNWRNLEFVENQSEEMCLNAVWQNGEAIEFVKNRTEEICNLAVRKNGLMLKYVENQTKNICLAAIINNAKAIEFVKEQTEEICVEAIRSAIFQGVDIFYCIKNKTEQIYLTAVKLDGLLLENITEQTEEICLSAIKQNHWAIEYVKNQTDEICMAAVKKNGIMLRFVKNQNLDILSEALNENLMSIIYIDVDVYKYNKNDIIKVYNDYILPRKDVNCNDDVWLYIYKFELIAGGHEFWREEFVNKLFEIINNFNNVDLVNAVKNDLKIIFDDDDFIGDNKLANLKQKAELLSDTSALLSNNIKPKKIL